MIVPNGMSRLKSTTGSLTSSAYQPVCLGHGTNHAAVHERNVLQVLVRDGHRSDGDLGFLAQNFHSHVGHQRSLHQLTVSAGSLFLSSTSVGATTLTASDALVDIRWQQVHLDTATIDIRRAKNGTPGIHGLQGDELRLLRALRREHPHADFVFLSERKAPLSVDGAQKLIERLGEAALRSLSAIEVELCAKLSNGPGAQIRQTQQRFVGS